LRKSSYCLALLLVLVACEDRSFRADLSSPDPAVRIRAIEFLGSQRDRTVIPQLIEATRDTAVEIKAKAAWALGMLQAKEALEPVSQMLSDPASRVRQSASGALLQIEEPEAIPALRAALAKETDEWVRKDIEAAIKHLIQFEGETDVGESSFRGNYL
jgi:HEAT repeat protein